MTIYYKKTSSVNPLKTFKQGDWIDLKSVETYHLKQGDLKYLSLGIVMKLPKDFEAILVPRSSTGKNLKLLQFNSIGVLDNSYSGPDDVWHFPAFAVENTTIKAGERICQFRIQPKMQASVWTKLRWLFTNKVVMKEITGDWICKENRGGLGSTNKIKD